MNPCVVARAVLTRIKADTTLWQSNNWTSALAGGASYMQGKPDSLVFPYLVYTVRWESDNNFTGMDGACNLSFSIFDQAAQGTDRLESLVDRIIGDAMLTTGSRTVPTYGFHNHHLVLPTNTQTALSGSWNLLECELNPSDTLQVNVATLGFSGRVSNQAANP